MAKQGRYDGKRLKVRDVLRLYATGERNFQGSILRGCDFRGVDLSEADFSRSDIRSAQFVDATLRNTKFCSAQAGRQRRWVLIQLITVTIFIAILAGTLLGPIGMIPRWGGALWLQDYVTRITLTAVIFFAIARQGSSLRAIAMIAISVAIIAIATLIIGAIIIGYYDITYAIRYNFYDWYNFYDSIIFIIYYLISLLGGTAFYILLIGAVAVACPRAFAGAEALAVAGAIAFAVAGTFAFVLTRFIYSYGSHTSDSQVNLFFALLLTDAFTVTFAGLLISFYISRRMHRREQKFENLRSLKLALNFLGGTSFRGSDMSGASFINARLKGVNFNASHHHKTCLHQVHWHNAQQLDCARLGSSILQDSRVATLLTTLDGINQDFSGTDLQGACLTNAHLHHINLNATNLEGALLDGADLRDANLAEARCINTNFTAACLSGACLEAWSIDETTILDSVNCTHVFLKKHSKSQEYGERRPRDPGQSFQPGDFERFLRGNLNVARVRMSNGIDPIALKMALERVMASHPTITSDFIQHIEKQGNDITLTLQVPEGGNQARIEHDWSEGYRLGLERSQILTPERPRKRAVAMKDVMLVISKALAFVQMRQRQQ